MSTVDTKTDALRTLVERVNGFVYHGDRLEAVTKAVRELKADPALLAAVLGGTVETQYAIRIAYAGRQPRVTETWTSPDRALAELGRFRHESEEDGDNLTYALVSQNVISTEWKEMTS